MANDAWHQAICDEYEVGDNPCFVLLADGLEANRLEDDGWDMAGKLYHLVQEEKEKDSPSSSSIPCTRPLHPAV